MNWNQRNAFWPGNATIDIDEITPLLLQVSGWILECQNACPTVWRRVAEHGGQMEMQLSVQNVQGWNVGPDNCYSEVFLLFPSFHAGKCQAHPIPHSIALQYRCNIFRKIKKPLPNSKRQKGDDQFAYCGPKIMQYPLNLRVILRFLLGACELIHIFIRNVKTFNK